MTCNILYDEMTTQCAVYHIDTGVILQHSSYLPCRLKVFMQQNFISAFLRLQDENLLKLRSTSLVEHRYIINR